MTLRNYRPNIAALLCFALLASCTPPGGPLVAQNPPMPGPVVPVVPTPQPEPKPEPKPDAPGITIPAETPIGKRLIATFCAPDNFKCDATWRFFEVSKDGWIRPTDAVDALIEGDRAILWATAGNYRAEVICAGKAFTADFTVGDPKPPEPPKPLAELAGKDAGALSAIYAELATAADKYGTVGVFQAVATQRLAPYANNPAVAVVNKRFAALGAPGDPIDVPRLKALLAEVVAELGAPGPAPVVVPGKRRIVILRESGDDKPADAQLYVMLRNGETAKALDAAGHQLFILDDDPDNQPPAVVEMLTKLNSIGVPPPAMFILDSANNVLFKGPRPSTVADVLKTLQDHD